MATHTLEMLRTLESVGFERKQAEAIADIVATHTDESYSKKADIVRLEGKVDSDTTRLEGKIEAAITRLEGKIDALEGKIDATQTQIGAMQGNIKLLVNMMIGLYIGIALLFLDRLL